MEKREQPGCYDGNYKSAMYELSEVVPRIKSLEELQKKDKSLRNKCLAFMGLGLTATTAYLFKNPTPDIMAVLTMGCGSIWSGMASLGYIGETGATVFFSGVETKRDLRHHLDRLQSFANAKMSSEEREDLMMTIKNAGLKPEILTDDFKVVVDNFKDYIVKQPQMDNVMKIRTQSLSSESNSQMRPGTT